jgi:hypothetical protein
MRDGGVAQLGERLLCKQEVIGSIPFTSTTLSEPMREPTAMWAGAWLSGLDCFVL